MAIRKSAGRAAAKHNSGARLDIEELAQALDKLEAQTELGRELIRLSKQGLLEGVEPLSADEINEYLGRPSYADE